MELETFVTEITTIIIRSLQGTPLASNSVDLGAVKGVLIPMISKIVEKLDKISFEKVLYMIKNVPLIQDCIIPNMTEVLKDGKLAVDDIPALLNIIVGIYTEVNRLFQSEKTITITSNDLIEVVGILLRVVIVVIVPISAQMNTGLSLVESAVSMVKLSVGLKKFPLKLRCCCS